MADGMRVKVKEIISEFISEGIPDYIPRDIDVGKYLSTRVATIITGPRQAGKTYLMYQIMDTLLDKGYDISDFIYINFEDNRLIGFGHDNFEDILNAYYELYPNKKPVLFLDEIHNITHWERFVRRLVEKRFKVFITGSNAKMLSKEYATHIAGRYVQLKVYPLSFNEFLRFRGEKFSKADLSSKRRYKVMNLLKEYLNVGGFPNVALSPRSLAKDLLADYLDGIVYKDISARYNVEESSLFKVLLAKLAENVGKPFSFHSIERSLQNIGLKTSRKTLITYYEYLKEGLVLLESLQQKESVSVRLRERKAYFIDNGYLNLFLVRENMGRAMENVVAVELARRGNNLMYFRNGREIDFVLANREGLQVTYDVQPREIEGLLSYMDIMKVKNGTIVSWDEENVIKEGNRTIRIIPLYRYLFE